MAELQVTVCKLTDAEGLNHLVMLHHAGQRAIDGMCVALRREPSEAESEASEWREFLTHPRGVNPPGGGQQ